MMNLKNKISLFSSVFFTLVISVTLCVVYLLFYNFRKSEFESRLKEKAISTIKLLVEVEGIDDNLLKVIDHNSIHKLLDEKILIFNSDFKLIYSSLDDTRIDWTKNDLMYLKKYKTFFKKKKDYEIYGVFYDTKDKDHYALISAKDIAGSRKLDYLFYTLIFTSIFSTLIIWVLNYKLIYNLLKPLNQFLFEIKNINEKNLDKRLNVKSTKDEIEILTNEFNQMLDRIYVSYKKQKEFSANASHELRTPIARMMLQLENKIEDEKNSSDFNKNMLIEVNRLKEITDSLLILTKQDKDLENNNEICRLDELIYESIEQTNKQFLNLKIELSFGDVDSLEIFGNKVLLLIVFQNLLKNAYYYSDKPIVKIEINSENEFIFIKFSNDGRLIPIKEQKSLFDAFSRGNHKKNSLGLGLGLRIVQRILHFHQAKIRYFVSEESKNVFELKFEK